MMRPAHQPRAALGASADAQSNAQPPPRHSRSKTPPVRRATTPVSRQLHSSHQQLQQAIGGRTTTPTGGGRFATPLASSSTTSLLASMLPTNGLHHPHHPHHHNNNTHLVTPGSARSKASSSGGSIADLEDTIVEVLGVRMQSLVDLRQRVDQLGDLYRREEETFRHQMRQVLERSEEVRVTNESREVELERALAKERADRTKVLELMSQFKKEGAAVIQVMKESLQEATTKWKAELEKNAKLTALLRRHGMDTSARSVSGNPSDGAAMNLNVHNSNNNVSAVSSAALQTRIEALTQLVQEEDSIIVALRSRNRALEQRVAVLTQQRDKLLEVDADQCVVTGSLQGELYDIQQAVRRCDAALIKETGASSSSPLTSPSVVPTPKGFRLLAEKCEALDRYSKLLLQRLSIEQRQRLRVEEQSARIASAQDQLVQSLESRIKDLGGGGVAIGGASAATPKHTAAASAAAGHQDGLPRFRPRGGSSSPLSSGVGGGNASTSTRNAAMNRPASGSSIHQGGEECSEDDDDGVVEEVREVLDEVSNTRVVLPLVSSTSRSSSTRAAASAATVVTVAERSASASSQVGQRNPPLTTSAPIVPLSSLEAQLALVTREFRGKQHSCCAAFGE
ncbi:Hypothetical protein, putative [Bodo saltans]|uniref:Uncharacterized protein n=1 Tax=Bodo saltans TaxID=75058 RepID=A0A0S4JIB6_BODSA|nr:Hypothetical protein, putative [Bodo saltans]|eukprot:CUG90082.1 Hypothetical protein, putative [Bodo saltans]